jgi:hypothetical protein
MTTTRGVFLAGAAFSLLAAPAVRAQAAPLRIGVLTDMSGPFSANSGAGSILAVRVSVENFGGTVRGRPVEVISADHQNRPDTGVSIAREWFDRQGHWCTSRRRARLPQTPSCYAMTSWRRMESGRPVASIRFSTATPMAASVC